MDYGPIETVACVGSSTTASKGTYRWISELQSRPRNDRFRFVNLGVGGDLSFNIVRRLHRVIEIQPDRVIILIGTNDILASVFPNFRRIVRLWKGREGLPDEPTAQRFRDNLSLITQKLRQETDARIALSSLAPVGEDPHSVDPVQSRLNDLYAAYNGAILEVSSRERTDYIGFDEAFRDELESSKTAKPFTRFSLSVLGTPVKVGIRWLFGLFVRVPARACSRWIRGRVKVERPQRSEDERP